MAGITATGPGGREQAAGSGSVGGWTPARGAHHARGTQRSLAPAGGDPVHRLGEALAARRVPAEQRELARRRGPEAGGGEADEPHRLAERDAIEQGARPPVDREPVLGR